MSTRKRRYRPDVPIDLTMEEEKGECSAKDQEETKKIGVKVVKRLNLKSKEVKEGVINLKVEIDIPLRWVMIWYCQQSGLDLQKTRFEFNGAMLRETDTPYQLGMVHNDVIFAFPIDNLGGSEHIARNYVTLCIRMHKERDTFVRVTRSTAIVPQLTRCFSDNESVEQGSLCFVYGGLKLAHNHIADELNMVDGDIIDGFNFNTMSSSLSTIGSSLTLIVKCVSGNETRFTVTQNTRLGQMMDRLRPYDSKLGRRDIHFVFGGRRLEDTETVKEAHLKDGDVIESLRCMYVC